MQKITIDIAGIKVPNATKQTVLECLYKKEHFALKNRNNSHFVIFLGNEFVLYLSKDKNVESTIKITNEHDLKNAVAFALVAHREVVPLERLLSFGERKRLLKQVAVW